MATQYTFKGTADMSGHDKAIQKSANEVKKYKEQCDEASQSASKIGKQDFSGAYRSQQKMENGVKGFTNAMNGASKGITGMIGKAGIWGAAIAAAISVGTKAIKGFRASMGRVNSELNDTFGRQSAAMQASWDRFLNKLSNFDLSHLREEMTAAAMAAQTLYDQLDRKNTYSYTANTDIARLNNDINELRNQVTEQRNAIKQKQRTQGKNVDISAENAEIKRLEALIDKKITELGNIATTQGNLARNAATGTMKAAGLGTGDLASKKSNAMEGLTASQRTEFEKIFQATMGGGTTNQFRFLTTDIEDQYLNELQRAIIATITQTGINRAAHGYPRDPRDPNATIAGDQVLANLGYRYQGMKNNHTQQDLDREAAMDAFISLIESLRSMISDDEGGVIDKANKHLQDAEAARAVQIEQRARQLADENKNNKVTTPSGPSYPAESIGWYEKEIQKLQEKIKKSTSTSAIEGFQASIDEYQRKINALQYGEGSIDYIKSEMTRVQKKISETSDKGVRQQLQAEYNALEAGLLDLQWPQETPQWVAGKIESLKRQLGEAVDDATRESLQAEIDSYTHVLNELENRNNQIGRIQAEIKQLQDEASRASGDDLHEKVGEIARLNHELNDLQNKKGSINWIQQEINLLNQELNAANSVSEIERLTNRIKELTIELAKLQNLSNINIEIKTNLDLVQDKINNLNSIASSTNQILGDMGAGFGYISEMIQGGKDWDDLSEAQQKTIETMNTLEEVFNRIGQACQAVLQFFTAMMEADLAATHAANTVAIEAETSAINQNTAAKAAGSLTATTLATSLGEETIAHGANATAATADAAASMISAGAGQADAASTVAAGAAKSAPFPANLAVIAAAIAAVIGIMSVIGSLSKFADGGIVGGNSFVGDRVFARVNSGEMILNDRQQANLFKLLNGNIGPQGGNGGGNVHFEIEGTRLVGVLDNITRSRRRVMG